MKIVKYAKLLSFCIVILLLLIFALPFVKNTYAVDRVYRGPIISPVNHILSANRGETIEGSVVFTNDLEQEGDISVKVRIYNFELNPDYSLNEGVQVGSNSNLASWIKLNKNSFSAKKGENVEIKYTITIPPNADYGDKFADIAFETGGDAPNNSTSPIYIKVKLQYPIVLNVGGKNDERLSIKSFRTSLAVYTEEEMAFLTEIENMGNKFLLPVGRVSVQNDWMPRKLEMDFNSNNGIKSGYVFAGSNSVRSFVDKGVTDWTDIGPHTATLTIKYGVNNEIIQAKTHFWVIPWKLILIVTIILFVLLIFILVKKARKNK